MQCSIIEEDEEENTILSGTNHHHSSVLSSSSSSSSHLTPVLNTNLVHEFTLESNPESTLFQETTPFQTNLESTPVQINPDSATVQTNSESTPEFVQVNEFAQDSLL